VSSWIGEDQPPSKKTKKKDNCWGRGGLKKFKNKKKKKTKTKTKGVALSRLLLHTFFHSMLLLLPFIFHDFVIWLCCAYFDLLRSMRVFQVCVQVECRLVQDEDIPSVR